MSEITPELKVKMLASANVAKVILKQLIDVTKSPEDTKLILQTALYILDNATNDDYSEEDTDEEA